MAGAQLCFLAHLQCGFVLVVISVNRQSKLFWSRGWECEPENRMIWLVHGWNCWRTLRGRCLQCSNNLFLVSDNKVDKATAQSPTNVQENTEQLPSTMSFPPVIINVHTCVRPRPLHTLYWLVIEWLCKLCSIHTFLFCRSEQNWKCTESSYKIDTIYETSNPLTTTSCSRFAIRHLQEDIINVSDFCIIWSS